MDVDSKLCLVLNVGQVISHLIVIVNPIHDEVSEPWVLSFGLKKSIEELEALLAKVVSEHLEGHQSLVLSKRLSEPRQAQIVYVIVSHV